jgi:hypothetical protein
VADNDRRFHAETLPNLPALGKQGGLTKTATSFGNFGQGGVPTGTGGGDFKNLAPQIRNPLLNVVNFYFPQDRKVLNQWLRYYQRFHPIVGAALDLHGEMIAGNFYLSGISDDKVLQVYNEAVAKCDLIQKNSEIITEFFNIGEAFPYVQWNETTGIFDQLIVVNPDYVHIRAHPFVHKPGGTTFEIEPSQALRDFVASRDPIDQELRQYVDPSILQAVQSNGMIKAHPFNMTGLIRRASPYDTRGTAITLRCLKDLMYEDILREAQWQIASAHVRPIWIYKLGDPSNQILPTVDDLRAFREVLLRGQFDPNFSIITSYAFNVENIGSQGKILPLIQEFDWVHKRVLTGLFTNEAETLGEGPNYQASSVARMIKNQRYMAYRTMLTTWMMEKIFKPIARAHGFRKKDGPNSNDRMRYKNNGSMESLTDDRNDEGLLLPTIEWANPLDMSDVESFRNAILRLSTDKFPRVAISTLLRVLGLDPKKEEAALKAQEGTVFDPLYQDYRTNYVQAEGRKRIGGPPGAGKGPGGGGGPDVGPPGGGGPAPDAGGGPAGEMPELPEGGGDVGGGELGGE